MHPEYYNQTYNYLPNHFITKFDDRVKQAYQYEGILTPDLFRVQTGNAKTFTFNRQSQLYTNKHRAHSDLILHSVKKDLVKCDVESWECSYEIDNIEKRQINYDEQQAAIASGMKAMTRRREAIMLNALNTGDLINDATHVVPKGISGRDNGLTLEALRKLKVLMDKAYIPQEDRYILASPEQIDNLLSDPRVTNINYNSVKVLVDGRPDSLLGFKFLQIPRFEATEGEFTGLPIDEAAKEETCYAWGGKGALSPLGLAVNLELNTRVDTIAHRGFSILLYWVLNMGSCIIDNKGVFKITCSTEFPTDLSGDITKVIGRTV